ncbi:hypothetical protein A3A74_05495 [Candidatus Roizmanbacteria bacterium RIFCSPLOWO2_01_FULL_35_13]|uniref:Uncharacterized protein n=1 Tax=Candidatus Roizmanbacteria bacterium RIFCSPLOWO2_01_FULL_35_13 TaxID=1802055 RepID=A0A1F7I978_9BACT|nr:MAG: hypothetical protein A3A74_05495 [Candidatus Roizmanbacteria bacterium RIFCSPLOWO2_01_FULL_35_13]
MKKRLLIDFLIIFALGLLPLLWFRDNQIILGHDSGLPFDPIAHFVDRLYLWSQHFGLGVDLNTGLMGAILIHGIEALITKIGFSLQYQEKIQFIFWFTLPGITMYIAARKFWPEKRYLPIIAAIIYMLNFYLLQGWLVAERTKFSLYAAFPIFVYYFIAYIIGKESFKKSVLISALILSVFNGGSSLPLYGGIFISIIAIVTYVNAVYLEKKVILRTIKFLFSTAIIYLLLNAFWIIPYFQFLTTSYSNNLAAVGGAEGALSWTMYLSLGSTFMNLLRGQGIPEWYLNQFHPYAQNFLNNPILIMGSLAYPLLFSFAFIFARKGRDKFYLYLLLFISLISLIFASGTRSQFSFIFNFLTLYLPGFAIFRSAYYKFDYPFWFSIALLIGFSLDHLFSKLETSLKLRQRNILPYISIIIFLILYILYHYPALNGLFFDYSSQPGSNLTTRITVPQYVFDFGKWANEQNVSERYLVFPELNPNTKYISYAWGYWSLGPITSTLAKGSFIQNNTGGTGDRLIEEAYLALKRDDMRKFRNIAKIFGIKKILLQKDFDWNHPLWLTTDPALYEQILKNNSHFSLEKTFGQWQVYNYLDGGENERISVGEKLEYVRGDLAGALSFPYFDSQFAIYNDDKDKNNGYFANQANDIFLVPKCNRCDLVKTEKSFVYNPTLLPGSLLYYWVEFNEEKVRNKSNDFPSMVNFYITTSSRRVMELNWMLNSQKKTDYVQSTLDRYLSIITEFRKFLSDRQWPLENENSIAENISHNLIQQSGIVEDLYDNGLINQPQREQFGSIYIEIGKILEISAKKLWRSDDPLNKNYSIESPKPGKYQLYVKRDSLSDPSLDPKLTNIIFSNEPSSKLSPIREQEGWLFYGDVDIPKGDAAVRLYDGTTNNLIAGVKPILPKDNSGMLVSGGTYSFTTNSHGQCFNIPVGNLSTREDAEYLVIFSYRNMTDMSRVGYYLSEVGELISPLTIKGSLLQNSRSWTTYSSIINPKSSTTIINFCNNFKGFREIYSLTEIKGQPNLPGQVVSEVANIFVYKISVPVMVLHAKQKDFDGENKIASFARIDPVSYSINLKDKKAKDEEKSFYLIFRDSFAKYWKVCENNQGCMSFDKKDHFQHAGLMNAWKITGDPRKLNLYYSPQRLYMIGAVITAASFLAIIFGSLYYLWIKKR